MTPGLSSCIASAGRGLAWSMTDVYAMISSDAGSGAATLGEISAALLNLGLTVEAARAALNTVAVNVGDNPQKVAAINAELNYLNTYGRTSSQNNWILPAVAIALGLWLLSTNEE